MDPPTLVVFLAGWRIGVGTKGRVGDMTTDGRTEEHPPVASLDGALPLHFVTEGTDGWIPLPLGWDYVNQLAVLAATCPTGEGGTVWSHTHFVRSLPSRFPSVIDESWRHSCGTSLDGRQSVQDEGCIMVISK